MVYLIPNIHIQKKECSKRDCSICKDAGLSKEFCYSESRNCSPNASLYTGLAIGSFFAIIIGPIFWWFLIDLKKWCDK